MLSVPGYGIVFPPTHQTLYEYHYILHFVQSRNHKARKFLSRQILASVARPGNIELKLLSIYTNEWAGRHEEKS